MAWERLPQNPDAPAAGAIPTGIVSVMHTFVAGAAAARLIAQVAADHDGARLAGPRSDATVTAFADATSAVAAAAAAALALHAGFPDADTRGSSRIAVCTGELAHDPRAEPRTPVLLVRAARLCEQTQDGHILICQTTATVVRTLPDNAALIELDAVRLRDVGRAETVHQLTLAGVPGTLLPALVHSTVVDRLPVPLTRFIGRRRELDELAVLVEDRRLITIVGEGGAGKTRLAIEAARRRARMFADGAWWADLSAASDADSVALSLLTGLDVGDLTNLTPAVRLHARLADRELLLVVDNCEHVVGDAAELIAELLAACPWLRILATSRQPLGVPGEQLFRLMPMAMPDESSAELDIPLLPSYDAVALFIERAVAARPNFRVDTTNAALVVELCSRLDGIPLAIELAASAVRTLTLGEVVSRLSTGLGLPTAAPVGVPERHRTLEGCVRWSHGLLEEPEQRLLRRLAVFPAGAPLDLIESTCAEPGERAAVLDVLMRLVDKSLVVATPPGRGALTGAAAPHATRFTMLETIRAYAAAKLAASGEDEWLRPRHARAVLALLESATPALRRLDDRSWIGVLAAEQPNVQAALEHAAHADPELALRIATENAWFQTLTGRYSAASHQLTEALSRASGTAAQVRARALEAFACNQLEAMEPLSNWGANLAAERLALGDLDAEGRARVTSVLALLDEMQSVGAGAPRLADAFGLADLADRPAERAYAILLQLLGGSCLREHHAAAAPLVESLDQLARALDSEVWWAGAASARGLAALRRGGDLQAVRADLERAVDITRVWDAPMTQYFATRALIELELHEGRWEDALHLVRSAEERLFGSGAGRFEGLLLQHARLELLTGAHEAALERVAPVRGALRDIPTWLAELHTIRGSCLLCAGDVDGAEAALREAGELAVVSASRLVIADVLDAMAECALTRGALRKADALLHEALGHRIDGELYALVPASLDLLARSGAPGGRNAEAARLLGAAEGLRARFGGVRPPRTEQACRDVLAAALAADPQLQEQYERAGSLSVDEAVAYARRSRGERGRPRTGWAALTPTELDVVRLAAAGHTNQQIADAGFMSRATVKRHLSSVFAKLDVSSRAELASRHAVEQREPA